MALSQRLREAHKEFLDEFQMISPAPEVIDLLMLSIEVPLPTILGLAGALSGVRVPAEEQVINWLSEQNVFSVPEISDWFADETKGFPRAFSLVVLFELVRRLLIEDLQFYNSGETTSS